jgi:hypothetical protein
MIRYRVSLFTLTALALVPALAAVACFEVIILTSSAKRSSCGGWWCRYRGARQRHARHRRGVKARAREVRVAQRATTTRHEA